jgi:hypothetical protein
MLMNRDLIFGFVLPMCVMASGLAAQSVHHVDLGATGFNDGTSWADAFNEVQTALAAAVAGDEIWVASGTYFPTSTSDRDVSFALISNVSIYGGFDGIELSIDQRDPVLNQTILSGDVGIVGDETDNSYHVVIASGTNTNTILDGFTISGGHANGPIPLMNDVGAGVFINQGGPVIVNCIIDSNSALRAGGGVFSAATVMGNAVDSQLIDCEISNNSVYGTGLTGATGGGGVFNGSTEPAASGIISMTRCTLFGNDSTAPGGGMIDFSGDSMLVDCTFRENSVLAWGGGLSNGSGFSNSTQTLIGCSFIGNISENRGGGMYSHISATAKIINCAFTGNVSMNAGGGGLYNRHSSQVDLVNCIFTGNRAEINSQGGAIKSVNDTVLRLTNCTIVGNTATSHASGGGVRLSSAASANISNCILWGNSSLGGVIDEAAQLDNTGTGMLVLDHSLVQGNTGLFGGIGNIDGDPLLADADGIDDIPGTDDDDLLLFAGSPCIDAGNNSMLPADSEDLDGDADLAEPIPFDFDGLARIVDDPLMIDTGMGMAPIVDMGASEYVGAASTDEGTDVVSVPVDAESGDSPITLVFDEVTGGGVTTLTISETGPPPPDGFQLGTPSNYYELTTTAEFVGSIEICIDYSGSGFVGNESNLKIEHFESGAWVDVTTSHDLVNDIICGTVTSLSPFAIFEPDESGNPCSVADLAEPFGLLDYFDVFAFVHAYTGRDEQADINNDGRVNFLDIIAFVHAFLDGCP